ncbi:MAG: aminoacyl-tRNA hydrolase [Acidiferrobacteraceae bacterium]|nr:aminoacyl-tRNA hydrolase [Acidiferrobacteraceae bacterium]
MTQINLIVGLGNPGQQYRDTRHNAGFWLIDELIAHHGETLRFETRFKGDTARIPIAVSNVHILRPRTFMNESGQSIGSFIRYFDIQPHAVLIIHDDLDLDPGSVRLKIGGGHAGHNGLRDIISHIDSNAFVRLRIGIGHPGSAHQVTDYVLQKPPGGERKAIFEVILRSIGLMDEIILGDHAAVMNKLHPLDC